MRDETRSLDNEGARDERLRSEDDAATSCNLERETVRARWIPSGPAIGARQWWCTSLQ